MIGHLASKDWLDALIFILNLVKMTKVTTGRTIREISGRGFNKVGAADDFHVDNGGGKSRLIVMSNMLQ